MDAIEQEQFNIDFAEALAFATDLHGKQFRKGSKIPYISHLIAVAAIVLEHGGNRHEAIGALLHDSIEDQGENYPGGVEGLRAKIREKFGQGVLDIVNGCTDAETFPKPPWKERKQQYIEHLAEVSDSVRLVSCADKLHGACSMASDLREIGDAFWNLFKGGCDGTIWNYEMLIAQFSTLGPHRLAKELALAVDELKALAYGPPPTAPAFAEPRP